MSDSQSHQNPYLRVSAVEDDEILGTSSEEELQELKHKRAAFKKREAVRNKLEAILWVFASAFILWYGNGDRDFITLLVHDQRIAR